MNRLDNSLDRLIQDYEKKACSTYKTDIINRIKQENVQKLYYTIDEKGENDEKAIKTSYHIWTGDEAIKYKDELEPWYKKGVTCRKAAVIALGILVSMLSTLLAAAPILGVFVITVITATAIISAVSLIGLFTGVVYYSSKANKIRDLFGYQHLFHAQKYVDDHIQVIKEQHKAGFVEAVAKEFGKYKAAEAINKLNNDWVNRP